MHSCAVDVAEFVFAQAVQLVLVEAAAGEEVCEDEREDRIATVRFLGQYTLAGLTIRSSESISTSTTPK